MLFDGRNGGTVELLDNVLVIRRKGVASFFTQGLKGEKRIPYSSITSVQFKEAGFTTGYIQFGIAGGIESGRGVWDATTDENTVLFTKEAAADFRKLRDLVENRAASGRSPAPQPTSTPQSSNVAEELTRLADLRDRGVLTEQEFAEQKARLLGSPTSPSPQSGTVQQVQGGRLASGTQRSQLKSSANVIEDERKTSLGKKLGLGCLFFLGIFVLLAALGSQVDETGNTTATADAENGPNDTPVEAADLPIEVTATELFGAYDANEASAQGYFGGRKLLVAGSVDKVTLDFLDNPVVGLRTPNEFMSAQAALADDAKSEAGGFSRGDKVKLLCEDISEVVGTPMLRDCRRAPADMKGQPVQWSNK